MSETYEKVGEIEAVGIKVLGDSNPAEMTQEQFYKSPDLLYHGTPDKEMMFVQEFDYRSEQYLANTDGSTTLGFGFYTTNRKKEAEGYSVVRQGKADATPIVISILPYQACVLDLRRVDDLSQNAFFPNDLAVKWQEYFENYLKKRTPREGNIGKILDSSEDEYAEYLIEALKLESIDLRTLLETGPSTELRSRNLPSPSWTLLFSDFMLEQGIDGIVYNERGELERESISPTFVFYNLKKIGTFENWQG